VIEIASEELRVVETMEGYREDEKGEVEGGV
jgi:hypothetical protein